MLISLSLSTCSSLFARRLELDSLTADGVRLRVIDGPVGVGLNQVRTGSSFCILEISFLGKELINSCNASTAVISREEIFLTAFQIRVSMSTINFGLSLPSCLDNCI